jgi:uncharacterized protein DUF992
MRRGRLVVVLAMGLATPALAEEPRTTIGVLTCTLAKTAEAQPGGMTCGFKATGSAAEEKYSGTVQGLSPLPDGKQVLVWSVIGPASIKVSGGLLAQRYARAKVAGQPPAWVGETNSGVVLQFETHGSAEAGSAIAGIELKLTGTSA